jgi:hypothetical protein
MQVRFELFRAAWASWQSLFQQAADFASRLGPTRLISISHSEDGNDGIVTVWYWAEGEAPEGEGQLLH